MSSNSEKSFKIEKPDIEHILKLVNKTIESSSELGGILSQNKR